MRHLAEILHRPGAPDADAGLITGVDGKNISYPELAASVAELQLEFRTHGLGGGTLLAVYLDKGIAALTAIFAALGNDSAYVPLDANAPLARTTTILGDSLVDGIVCGDAAAGELQSLLRCNVRRQRLASPGLNLLLCEWPQPRPEPLEPGLAAVLYTSGSTGKPKGVQLTHGNMLAFVEWCIATFAIDASDRIVSIAPFNFDLSVFDIFVSTYHRSSLLLLDHQTCQNSIALAQHMSEAGVTVCYSTPTLLSMLARFGRLAKQPLDRLRLLLFAGEIFPLDQLRALAGHLDGCRLYNLYGPTETNVVTWFELPAAIPADRTKPFPIGRPCDHAGCMLLRGGTAAACAPGEEGELLVTGPSVTPGYLGGGHGSDRFFLAADGQRYYRSGDRVQVTPDGDLEYLGRLDRTIKRRGYRIALEEVEAAVQSHTAIEKAAAVHMAGPDGRLTIFYAAGAHGNAPGQRELKAFFLSRLPAYFLPDRFVELEELPATTSGKIDYQALGKL